MNQRQFYPFLLILLCAVLFLFGLGWRDFWAPVEPRYAEIARVMFSKGDWIVPTVNGHLYTDKPILYFWLVLLASKLGGAVNEWTVRLPSALAGMGVVLTTYALGQTFFSATTGLIAAAVLATSFRIIWESRWAHTDMVFLFFFTWSLYLAARSVFRRGHRDQILLAYGFMGLATLTKGLIGVVLPALILLAYMVIRRDWQMLRDAKLPLGIVIFITVAGPWFYLVSRATQGKWLTDFIYIHHIQRYTAGTGHREPLYYYLTTLPADFLPWTIFLIPALFAARFDRKGQAKPESLLFVLWFFVVFLFFSGSDTKRDLYLLPLFPPLALYIAFYLNNLIRDTSAQSAWYRNLTITFFALLVVLGLAAPAGAKLLRPDAFWITLPGGFVIAAGGFFAVRFIRMRAPLNMVGAVTVMMAATVVTASIWIFPYVENFKSIRPFSQEIKKIIPSGTPLYVFADSMDDFNYYLERDVIPVVRSPVTVEKLLSQPGSGYLLIKTKDLARVKMISEQSFVATQSRGGTTWNLVALRP